MHDVELHCVSDLIHQAHEVCNDACVSANVQWLRAELEKADNIDEREELLACQLESLDSVARRVYVKLLAYEAFEQSQDLCFVLSQLSVATAGTRFLDEISKAIGLVNELLEALSITGSPNEVFARDDRPGK